MWIFTGDPKERVECRVARMTGLASTALARSGSAVFAAKFLTDDRSVGIDFLGWSLPLGFRPVFKDDEPLMIAVGAILGALVGEIQVQIIEHLGH
ncbi:MAG: hypothetical protein QOC62_4892 [Mycobacterium sp.]|jgi:hypothetical protein|nr:hypothetical protein [Mycobacterium sp.]